VPTQSSGTWATDTFDARSTSPRVWFLRRVDTAQSSAWWAAVADYPTSAPSIVQELLRTSSVVCDGIEARQALAWARAHPLWRDDTPALEALDAVASE
jgi:hypothetical protein